MSATRPTLRIFADHNVPDSAAVAFEAAGHGVRRLRDVLPKDAPDDLVAATAITAGEILLTHDADFKSLAKRVGAPGQKFAKLSLVKLSCEEHLSAARLTACMSLIEHEWRYAQERGNGVLRMEIQTAVIRCMR